MCEDMSIATNLICGLRLAGMISGSYLGYRYGDKIKTWCCGFPSVGHYHKEYIYKHFKKSQIPENTMFNLIGCFSGILGGFYAWPLSIPMMFYQVAEDNPDEFKKLKNFFKE